MKKDKLTINKRIRLLEQYGSPGALSHATALQEHFPHAVWRRDGYWAYVALKSPVPFVPDTFFLVGDPICAPEEMARFVRYAVDKLRARGRVAALQVHRRTALAFESLGDSSYVAHQMGVETQVNLPCRLTGQLGTKLRQAVRQGLYVEELAWRIQDLDPGSPGVEVCVECQGIDVRKSKTRIRAEEYADDLRGRQVVQRSGARSGCGPLVARIDEMLQTNHHPALEEFRRKVDRFRQGVLPYDVSLFVEHKGKQIAAFGFYQPTPSGYNRHRFEVLETVTGQSCRVLVPGKKLLDADDLASLERLNQRWLARQLNPEDMGPPLLKPFSREYEPGRRLFVAREPGGRMVAFVDFDPVDWVYADGRVDREKRGYYANMLRRIVGEEGERAWRNTNYLILGAAAQRFVQEGCSVLNLGLNPLGLIGRDRAASGKDPFGKSGLTLVEMLLSWVGRSGFMNATTYAYRNVMRTKQQNWRDREDVTVYSVFDGRLLSPLVDVLKSFFATGAVGRHVLANTVHYVVNGGRRTARRVLAVK